MRTEEGATKLVIRTRSRAAACGVAVATFLLLFASPSSPQSTATIEGTVVDHDGGVLPGLVVTVNGSEARQQGVTDAVGWFSFTGLPAGDYAVTAALPGYVTIVSVQTGATVPLVLSPRFPPGHEPRVITIRDRSWAQVVFGWPFVSVAVVLFGVGLLRRQSSFVLLGSFFAAPFCLYLSGTPRFRFVAPIAWLSSIAAARALARGRTTTAALLVIPFVGLAAFVAWLVMTQPEPW